MHSRPKSSTDRPVKLNDTSSLARQFHSSTLYYIRIVFFIYFLYRQRPFIYTSTRMSVVYKAEGW